MSDLSDIKKDLPAIIDLLQGDPDVYRNELEGIDLKKLQAGVDYILNNERLSAGEKSDLIANSWRVNYREKPPTPEEFLSSKYIGRMAPAIYPRVRKWFLDFFDETKPYLNAVLYSYIGSGKSTLAVLINLYICTHIALMRDPKKYLNQAPSAILAFVLGSYSMKKGSEVLLEPFLNMLEVSEYFVKMRTKEDMVKIEKHYQKEEIHGNVFWTTASIQGASQIQFSNGIQFKLVSSVHNLLGLTIICGTMTELAFFREAGKSLALDTKIITPNGYTLMRNIKIGDEICTPSGKTSKVIAIHPQGITKVYELTFSDGRSVISNPSHRWKTKRWNNGPWKIMTTEQILNNMKDSKHRWIIPLSNPVPFLKKEHFISPYLIGFLLGDGSFRSNSICISVGKKDKDEIKPILENELHPPFQLSNYTKTQYFRIRRETRNSNIPNEYCVEIKRLGLLESRSPNKFIPQDYLFDSIENRITLLQGLLDTDGYSGKKGEIVFSTTSERLATDIIFLVRSLGGLASLQKRQDTRKSSYLLTYKIQISFPSNSFPVFKLTRKQNRINEWWKTKKSNNRQTLRLISISPVVDRETQCITIDDNEHLFLANDFISNLNSDEYILRFFNDLKRRIHSRMKGNYWGRSILDSSPNDLESPIDKYCMFDAQKDSSNYVVSGSRWQWEPEEYKHLNDRFPVFKGGNGKPPMILTNTSGYQPDDILMVPREDYQLFHDELQKSLKDIAGIPQGNLDKIFYDYKKIDDCFIENMKSIEFCIKADARMPPQGLIWNVVKDTFFIQSGTAYHFWYKPRIPRVFHIDQSLTTDMTAIAFAHVERKLPSPGMSIDLQKDIVYVVDFVIPIHPFGGRINLDAVREFITDVYTKGGISIVQGSFDHFESAASIDHLARFGLIMEHVSVDETLDPYMFLAQTIEQGNLKMGRNIFMKNNLKSLRISASKIAHKLKVDHSTGDVVSPSFNDNIGWDTSLLGLHAKDVSDAVCGAVYNAKTYLATDGQSLMQTWDRDSIIVTPDSIKKKTTSLIKEMGFVLPY